MYEDAIWMICSTNSVACMQFREENRAPGPSHQAESSELGGGTSRGMSESDCTKCLRHVHSATSWGSTKDANFSSSFSPGDVDTTLSRSILERAARFTVSIMRTLALNSANTKEQDQPAFLQERGRDVYLACGLIPSVPLGNRL